MPSETTSPLRQHETELLSSDCHTPRPTEKILCLGLVRTGSTSMFLALKQLGYRCSTSTLRSYQMLDDGQKESDHSLWLVALEARYFGRGRKFVRADWEHMLAKCEAVTDFPAAAFAPELISCFPDAKVILTARPADAWFESVNKCVIPLTKARILSILPWTDSGPFGGWLAMLRAMMLGVFGADFNEGGKRAYEDHNAMVRALVPKERLLVYQPGDGWEPLCKFLGVSVPRSEYPRVNEAKAYKEKMDVIVAVAFRRVLRSAVRIVGISVLLIGFIWMLHR